MFEHMSEHLPFNCEDAIPDLLIPSLLIHLLTIGKVLIFVGIFASIVSFYYCISTNNHNYINDLSDDRKFACFFLFGTNDNTTSSDEFQTILNSYTRLVKDIKLVKKRELIKALLETLRETCRIWKWTTNDYTKKRIQEIIAVQLISLAKIVQNELNNQ